MDEIKTNKAIIVGVCSSKTEETLFNYEMKELESLAECWTWSDNNEVKTVVVKSIVQYLDNPSKATYVGKGKLIEIAEEASILEADVVIFNDELSPSTLSNIADVVECEIIDRTMLILDIFKTRAKTKEARLQVALAERNYMLPRLVGARKNLSRIGGTGGGAGATRGSGETKLELDHRKIENEIYKIKQELSEIVKSRQTTRTLRKKQNVPVVAVVGYTNAGKSTTINSILKKYGLAAEDKSVFVKDMLFATLETASRGIKLENNHEFLITDTVGFVQKLPHHLVESFKSTLEEIKEASLIVHIIDSSSPYLEYQIKTTIDVLNNLGCSSIPMVYVYNKHDLVVNDILLPKNYKPLLYLSNKTSEGIDGLVEYIDQALYPSNRKVEMLLPYTKGDIYNNLKEHATIHETEYTNDGIKVIVSLSEYLFNLYFDYINYEIK